MLIPTAKCTLYISKKEYPKCIDLLYWKEHYAWIKNFSAFMADVSWNNKMYWCKARLGHWKSENEFKIHKEWCRGFDDAGQIFFTPDPWVKTKFEHHAYVSPLVFPFLIF